MKTILIIDDDSGFRRLLEKTLTRRGYRVFIAANGKTGLQRFDAEQPDVVITDIFMPEKDGLEVITALASAGQAQKVIAVTGNAHGNVYLEMAEMMTASYTFDKPLDMERLFAAIDEITAYDPMSVSVAKTTNAPSHINDRIG